MMGKRKRYSAEFKAKVAMEALRGELTVAQLATKHGVHQTVIGDWKRQAVEGLVGPVTAKLCDLAIWGMTMIRADVRSRSEAGVHSAA